MRIGSVSRRVAIVALALGIGLYVGRGWSPSSHAPSKGRLAAYPVGRFPFYVVEGHQIGVVMSVSGTGYTVIVGNGRNDVREVHRSWRDLFLRAK